MVWAGGRVFLLNPGDAVFLLAKEKKRDPCGFTFEVQRDEGFGGGLEAEAFSGRMVVFGEDG
uniref:hypothetical protein n=1 Tax=Sphingomonas sp. Leaf24 TaxID=1735690 RepID=UPI001F3D29EC